MKRTNYGFTLVELLVVVLVIGILAAIAVPQYQKAVFKSRAGQIMTLVRSLGEAQESYFLAHGQYANSFDDLDLTIPVAQEIRYGKPSKQFGDWDISMYCTGGRTSCESVEASYGGDAEQYMFKIAYYLRNKRGTNIFRNAGTLICIAGNQTASKKKKGQEACQSFGGGLIDTSDDRYYKLPF